MDSTRLTLNDLTPCGCMEEDAKRPKVCLCTEPVAEGCVIEQMELSCMNCGRTLSVIPFEDYNTAVHRAVKRWNATVKKESKVSA